MSIPDTIREEITFISAFDDREDYYILEYPESGVTGPLVMYLHGGLSHAQQGFSMDFNWTFENLRNEVIKRGGAYFAPEYRGDSWMNEGAEADVVELITTLAKRFGTQQFVVVGGSMGGTSAFILTAHHPELIDGVIALCPATSMIQQYNDMMAREELIFKTLIGTVTEAYGGTPDTARHEYEIRSSIRYVDLMKMPMIIRHGSKDDMINVEHSRKLVAALKTRGANYIYDELDGGDHDRPVIGAPWKDYFDFILGS